MKTINIYLTKEEQQKCRTLQNKYHVSLSTLTDKVVFYTFKYIDKQSKIFNEYIGKGYKTSIKPKCLLDEGQYLNQYFKDSRNKNIFATNCLKIFIEKDIKKYIDADNISKYYADIDRELQKANDPNWDYNQRLRNMVKLVKNNKDYFRKFLQ